MSSTSGAKSKRNSKSVSADSSSSRNDGKISNKKKKTTQKTLGMAWGANSQSASRSAFRNSPFSDFGSYMAVKNQKLSEQFDAAASSSTRSGCSTSKPLFSGVSIFVDGYTVPSSQELRAYMLKYGGRFENYFSRHRVTHIICSNLPDRKIKNLRAFSGGLPVVKPDWLVDSVAANKLLSCFPYQLDQLASESDKQPKLSAFFAREKDGATWAGNSLVDVKVVAGIDDQVVVDEISCTSECSASLRPSDMCNVQVDSFIRVKANEMEVVESAYSVEGSREQKVVNLNENSPIDENCKFQPHASGGNGALNDCYSHDASSSKVILPSSRSHSTLSDPNFVENYFKSSRLHFIGSWRNRYRKRFPASTVSGNSCLKMASSKEKTIIHIDMDCFFVSVVTRNRPELLGKPVVVCHSDSSRGTAEISSANYSARNYGVKAGMFVKDAKMLCPHLMIVSYDFEAYEKVADQFYDILHKHCNKVQAVSCDEAFLDISDSEAADPQLVASIIRMEILETTGCTASAGIAENMLIARLATRSAKPDGQCYIPSEKVNNYLCSLPVKALPGIGHVLESKLEKKKIRTCGQLRLITKDSLQKDFGMKTGEMLWNYSRGIDSRLVGLVQDNKSIGAEVNWGVRFRNTDDIHNFLKSLCKEVALRLKGCGVLGRSFTLKVKKKRSDTGVPVKYMGCGDCENLSHTITIPMSTDDVHILQRVTTRLFGYFQIDAQDIRGMGLQVSKLEGAEDGRTAQQKRSIRPWLFSMSARTTGQEQRPAVTSNFNSTCVSTTAGSFDEMIPHASSSEAGAPRPSRLPPLEDLDWAVIQSLPPDILSEINGMYDGKLLGFVSAQTSTNFSHIMNDDSRAHAQEPDCVPAHLIKSHMVAAENRNHEEPPLSVAEFDSFFPKNMMPLSLTQVDCSVLEQLPDDLRKDIIKLLPLHRQPELANCSSPQASDQIAQFSSSEPYDLWVGSPPKWVRMFEIRNCTVLSDFAKIYKSSCNGHLSSVLQLMNYRILSREVTFDGGSDIFSFICELFKQYVDLKIATDIEEIYCFARLLKRFKMKSEFFSRVYEKILPHLQTTVAGKYGGTLMIP